MHRLKHARFIAFSRFVSLTVMRLTLRLGEGNQESQGKLPPRNKVGFNKTTFEFLLIYSRDVSFSARKRYRAM